VIGSGLIGMWNSNLWTSGFIVQNERRGGTIELLLAAPTSMLLVLFGKSLANALISVLAIGITFLTGALVLRVPLGLDHPLAFLGALVLTVFALTTLGLVFATGFILSRAAGRMAEVLNYPIFILSGLTFPITTLPLWTRPLSFSLAPTWGNLAMGAAAGLGEGLLATYLWLGLLGILYFVIAVGLYQWIERIARQQGRLQEF
jgi:ABC-2 type transport system permease protein